MQNKDYIRFINFYGNEFENGQYSVYVFINYFTFVAINLIIFISS